MSGRSCKCLFAAVWLILGGVPTCSRLWAQSGSSNHLSLLQRQTLSADKVPGPGPQQNLRFRMPPSPGNPARPVHPVATNLAEMVHASGMIFSGQVVSIAHDSTIGGASIETIAITFHIDRALRGPGTGRNVTIHEWLGAWSSGQRYRAGERILLFLYPTSKLGLTSCVAGPLGRLKVDAAGRILLSVQHLLAFGHDPIVAGRSRISLDDFAGAVRGVGGEERVQP